MTVERFQIGGEIYIENGPERVWARMRSLFDVVLNSDGIDDDAEHILYLYRRQLLELVDDWSRVETVTGKQALNGRANIIEMMTWDYINGDDDFKALLKANGIGQGGE